MLRGTITFAARLTQNRLTFPRLDFRPARFRDLRIEMESDGENIRSVVHFESVPTSEEAEQAAIVALEASFDFIAFRYGVAIGSANREDVRLTPLNPLYAQAGAGVFTGRGCARHRPLRGER